jgi:lipoprotein-anchoring transpeptidase ErfK/SrfK
MTDFAQTPSSLRDRLRRRRRAPFWQTLLDLPARRSVRIAVGVVLLVCFGLLWSTGFHYQRPSNVEAASMVTSKSTGKALPATLQKEQRELKTALTKKVITGNYIVIDVTNNRLLLRTGDSVLREAKCSTGSGIRLKEGGANGREWEFDTPRGMFHVLQKVEDPVWKKPDWAFVEDQEPVPTDPSDRMAPDMMGEYGLHLGHGYLIHGTLYERLLGRSVTHGCVRLGRDDLRAVYAASKIGTPVIIY